MRRNEVQAALIRGYAEGKNLEVYEIMGQWLFPIYAASGGLATKYITYFVNPDSGYKVPRDGEDLGREGSCNPALIAIEFEYFWDDGETIEHLKSVVGAALLVKEIENVSARQI
jgi:hypothetical protein